MLLVAGCGWTDLLAVGRTPALGRTLAASCGCCGALQMGGMERGCRRTVAHGRICCRRGVLLVESKADAGSGQIAMGAAATQPRRRAALDGSC
ncbi:hypothetical protein ACLOJK_034474 [Asimina triloba]